MKLFEVRKNTLPYIHQYSVIVVSTGNVVKTFKNIKEASEYAELLNNDPVRQKTALTSENKSQPVKNAFDAIEKRFECPDGDKYPGPRTRRSDSRKIELD